MPEHLLHGSLHPPVGHRDSQRGLPNVVMETPLASLAAAGTRMSFPERGGNAGGKRLGQLNTFC